PPFPLLPSLHHTLPTPFPYTTLFRSSVVQELGVRKKFTERDPVLVVPAPLLIRGATPLFSGEYVLDRREGIEEYPSFWREVCQRDRKSTRLNSSHVSISYAVFCLKNK